jgi:hypothetical protein
MDEALLTQCFLPDHEALAAVGPQACHGPNDAAFIDDYRGERSAACSCSRPDARGRHAAAE